MDEGEEIKGWLLCKQTPVFFTFYIRYQYSWLLKEDTQMSCHEWIHHTSKTGNIGKKKLADKHRYTHTQTGHTRKTHEAHKYFFVLDIINTIWLLFIFSGWCFQVTKELEDGSKTNLNAENC